MDYEIDLRDILLILWKNRLLIIGILLVAVVAAGAITFAMGPVYRISSVVSLGNFGDLDYTTQASANEIMLSEGFILDAIGRLNISVSPREFKEIRDGLKIYPVKGSERLLAISLDTRRPREGKEIVEEIVGHFANRSQESYNEQKRILVHQLASVQERLAAVEKDINQTREAIDNLEKAQGSLQMEGELRISRMLDLLNGEESRRSALVDRYLDLQKQLDLFRSLEFVQPPREPITPIWPRWSLIIGVAGIIGLMIGIFVVFLREALRRPGE
jgi:uncharacterized protein involved in exopolysaccharide biosynthesis